MARRAPFTIITTMLLTLAASAPTLAVPALHIQPSVETASEGYLNLSWATPAPSGSLLQVSNDPAFVSEVRHFKLLEQQQISISGLPNGSYYSRIIDPDSKPLSDTAQFQVTHRSLRSASALFITGAVLFALLIGTIISLSRRSDR